MRSQIIARAKRTKTFIRATLDLGEQQLDGNVLDISDTGMSLILDDLQAFQPHQRLEIVATPFGRLTGKARWQRNRIIGIRFENSSVNAAHLASYRRYHAV